MTRLLWLLTLLSVAGLTWISSQVSATQDALAQTLAPSETLLEVKAGATPGQLIGQWVAEGRLEQAPDLRIVRRLQPELLNLKAGVYDQSSPMTLAAMLAQLTSGVSLNRFLTLVPGWSLWQVQAALAQAPDLTQTLPADLNQWAAPLGLEGWVEGQFLPDTYAYTPGESDVEVLKRAHAALNQVLKEAWQDRAEDLPLSSSDEALVLASIVEKESGVEAERAKIAGVFTQRLKRGMKLQTDPTVIYPLLPDWDGNIRTRDLRAVNDYNTYVIDGLPPTPIALASASAIRATVSPEETGYLFFVADGQGGHLFSKTYAEHEKRVKAYWDSRP